MISRSVNGFTAAQVEAALARATGTGEYRIRAELTTEDGTKIRDVTTLITGGGAGEILNNADAEVHRTGRVRFREENLELDAYATMVIADEALGYWRLGDTSGTTAIDSSGNGRNGTYRNSPSLNQASLLAGDQTNASVLFQTNEDVTIADNAAWDTIGVTLEAWINTTHSASRQHIIARGSQHQLRVMETTGFLSFVVFVGSVANVFTTDVPVNDGRDHHVVGTYDGTSADSYVTVYVDGVQVSRTAQTGSLDPQATTLEIGSVGGTSYFNGNIDEAAVYGYGLTPAQVLTHYQAGSGNLGEVLFDKRLRVVLYAAVKMESNGTDGTPWAEVSLGRFLMSAPSRGSNEFERFREVELFDEGVTLQNNKIAARYTVAGGANYITAVNAALVAAGKTTAGYTLTSTSHTLPEARDWDIGTSYLTIINDLLFAINYKSFRYNNLGNGVAEPYVLPKNRTAEFTYETVEPSMVFPEITVGVEISQVTNQVIATIESPNRVISSATATNTKTTSPTSNTKSGLGYTNVLKKPTQAVNTTVLAEIASRELTEESMIFEVIDFLTYLNPFHDDLDCVQFRDTTADHALGIDNKFISVEWRFPLDEAGRMSHRFKRAVDVTT